MSDEYLVAITFILTVGVCDCVKRHCRFKAQEKQRKESKMA